MAVFLGIDTSCYTTSVALADEEKNIVCNLKIPLEVAQGEKGLQQSQAVFLHIRNLRTIFEENILAKHGDISAVCVSATPRPQEGSYMPVFTVSAMAGAMAASVTGAALFEVTHQHGHIAAALIGNRKPETFLAVHVSGGTTEIVKVDSGKGGFDIEVAGATKDIAAGQVIDRLGQMLDMPFPAGRYVEECAQQSTEELGFKISTSGTDMNFSGVEAQMGRALETYDAGTVCASVLTAVGKTLEKAVKEAIKENGIGDVLFFGGVMSNKRIRAYLSERIPQAQFAKIEYSADNAAGLAVLAMEYANR
ncbi:MAG: hypothetical protein VB081_13990 [Christensenella sp.]|uniref:hypothetical protein n=1 Tax=Christensenella sp. TaxID=1935934 RepID=UPI002B207BA5|nr:hypothetical protein [Christensenella sp.]MEA5004593.1 hypothetical protein [Christensenella sp.]